jgi:hypothetical protein
MHSLGCRAPLRGSIVVLALAGSAMASAHWTAAQPARQSTSSAYDYALGNVTVTIPPPKGFEEVLGRFDDIRKRNPDSERLENLAMHLPSDVAKSFTPGQDLTFYTKVSVSRAGRAVEITDAFFADAAKQVAGANAFDQDAVKQRLAELEKQRGVAITQPLQMGTIDQTPNSMTTLALAAVSAGDRKVNLLMTTTLLHVRRRLVFAYAYRVFETSRDRTVLETLTKDWVRGILAANP